MKIKTSFVLLLWFLAMSCSSNSQELNTSSNHNPDENSSQENTIKLLSLGDSYTIGHSVCETCRFPEQLKLALESHYSTSGSVELKIIAQTGWTTTNLLSAIDAANLNSNYDLVTLLIGVNNQYSHLNFSIYETEFAALVEKAKALASNDPSKVIVISIPDYAYTPYGQGSANPQQISTEIDEYNQFAQDYCSENDISYVYITDITRLGLEQTSLVASDGLHPSGLAYTQFVERILPVALEKLDD